MTKHESAMLDTAAEAAQDARNRAKRKKWLLILGSTVLSNAIGYGVYSHYYGSKFISTDNAYTAAETAQVTPAISGIVREVRVTDTQQVQRGDVWMTPMRVSHSRRRKRSWDERCVECAAMSQPIAVSRRSWSRVTRIWCVRRSISIVARHSLLRAPSRVMS
jgi:hypothetical protein